MNYGWMESAVGEILIVADEVAVKMIRFPGERRTDRVVEEGRQGGALVAETRRQLDEYFRGSRREFDLPVAPAGTPFQLRAWQALQDIPYGATCSYGEQARAMGRPRAVRAVGAANGRNPIAIVIPCHRVIGRDGRLTGYGGGLDVKQYLLELEQRHVDGGRGQVRRGLRSGGTADRFAREKEQRHEAR